MLSSDDLNDLRRRVLRGEQLTIDEARKVFTFLRGDAAVAAGAVAAKARAPGKKKVAMTDEALDSSLDMLLNKP